MTIQPTRIMLRVEEAAEQVGLGRSKLYQLIQAGEIPAVKIGRATRIPTQALQEWAEKQIRLAAV